MSWYRGIGLMMVSKSRNVGEAITVCLVMFLVVLPDRMKYLEGLLWCGVCL